MRNEEGLTIAEGMLAALAPEVLAAAATSIPELTAIGLTGAEIAAATPAMGATAGAGLGQGALVAGTSPAGLFGFPALGTEFAVPEMSWMERLTANPMSALREVMPSKDTLGTIRDVGTVGYLGKSLLTPPPARPLSPVPALSSGSTRRYQPTTDAPIQNLANLIAQRRQATAQRRFA